MAAQFTSYSGGAGLLARIISRQEDSAKILIEDNVGINGRHVIKSFLCQITCNYDVCHVLLTDIARGAWSKGLPTSVLQKTRFHNLYSDPLNWNLSSSLDSIHKLLQPEDLSHSAVLVDNVSSLMNRYQYSNLCRWLHTLGRRCPVACLMHRDLHDDHVISALHHVMTSIIQLSPVHHHSSKCSGSCTITHRRRSGKLMRAEEVYLISDGFVLTSRDPSKQGELEQKQPVVDPAANLTFDLRLTDQQKEDRSRVVLPYTRPMQRGGGGGKVYYEPDEVDDIDESDPDDDLDV